MSSTPPSAGKGLGPAAPSKARWILLIAGALVFGMLLGLVVFKPGRKRARNASQAEAVLPAAATLTRLQESAPSHPTLAPPAPREALAPIKHHIEISVQPSDSTLSLDNRATGANRLELDVPRSETVHVVQATAPGHVPFKKSLRFDSDVHLSIKLKRIDPPALLPAGSKARTTKPGVPAPKSDGRPELKPDTKPAAAASQAEDFGMKLQRPSSRRPTRKIDETDPYAP